MNLEHRESKSQQLGRRRLGHSDLMISEVGLGGNTFGTPRLSKAESIRTIQAGIERGVNFIDTASVYGQGESETFVGEATESHDDIVVATKVNLRKYPEESVSDIVSDQLATSLRKLRRDQIDLYQLHSYKPGLTQQELLEALAPHVESGVVRYYGVCNYSAWRAAELCATADRLGLPRPVSIQNYYNLLDRAAEREVLPFCEEYSVSFLPYHPLAGGFLTGKYRPDTPPPPGTRGAQGSRIIDVVSTERNWALVERVEELARSLGCTPADIAIQWTLSNRFVASVIAGVSNEEQVRANVASASMSLSTDDLEPLTRTLEMERSPEVLPYG